MKYYVATCLLFCAITVRSQQYQYVYYFNKNLKPVKKADATITGKGANTPRGVIVNFFSSKTTVKLATMEFTDSTLSINNGRSTEFFANGRVKQNAYYKNGILDGTMEKWNDKGRKMDSLIYKDDKLISQTTFSSIRLDQIYRTREATDNLNERYVFDFVDSLGRLRMAAEFLGNKGVLKHYDSNGNITKSDSVYDRGVTTTAYPGGPQAWREFLVQNLRVETPSDNRAPRGNYTTLIEFTVNADGSLANYTPLTSHGYGMEKEAIRVIEKSGKWIPTMLFGKKIESQRIQPLTYQIL